MPQRAMRDLRAWREERGMMAKEVAEILGYSVEHISRCEHGKRQLSDIAWRLLEAHVARREAA